MALSRVAYEFKLLSLSASEASGNPLDGVPTQVYRAARIGSGKGGIGALHATDSGSGSSGSGSGRSRFAVSQSGLSPLLIRKVRDVLNAAAAVAAAGAAGKGRVHEGPDKKRRKPDAGEGGAEDSKLSIFSETSAHPGLHGSKPTANTKPAAAVVANADDDDDDIFSGAGDYVPVGALGAKI
jgi:hypothetical protein